MSRAILQREKSIAINNMLLPEDVLLEILARLPVKSLLRFRSVSKSWRDMMKEPTFINKHYLTQAALKDGKCYLLKINSKVLGCLAGVEQGGIKFTRWELPFLSSANHHQAAGPCNGIFIIKDGFNQLFLWNPATREYKALPQSLEMSLSDRFSRVGFGIDPISKDCKVVIIWHFGWPVNDEFNGKVEVMSLSATDSFKPKSEMWKTIDAVPPTRSAFSFTDQVYANGKYYWLDEHGRVLWFDMGAEVFGLIHVPRLLFSSFYNRITVVKGSLALIRPEYKVEYNKTMYEIWIIDDYPWIKYATIPLMKYQDPLGFWNDQEVFVLGIPELDPVTYDDIRQVFSYDIKTNAIKKKMEGLHIENMFHASVDMYI